MPSPSLDTLRALRDKVAGATEPSREIDAEICQVLGIEPWTGWWADRLRFFAHGSTLDCETPRFTGRVDDVISLARQVLPRWSIMLGLNEGYRFSVVTMGRSYPTNMKAAAEHHTLPLAALLTVFDALIAEQEGSHVER